MDGTVTTTETGVTLYRYAIGSLEDRVESLEKKLLALEEKEMK